MGKVCGNGKLTNVPKYLRWQAITGVDVGSDLLGFLSPLVFVWNLNMKVSLKAEVILAFSFRLPMIALSVLHLRSFASLRQSDDLQSSITTNLLYLQGMLAWSLVSATIPNLSGLMRSFDTSFGMPAAPGNSNQRDAYPLVTMGGTSNGSRRVRERQSGSEEPHCGDGMDSDNEPSSRPGTNHNTTTSLHADSASHTTGEDHQYTNENGSQELIIAKDIPSDLRYTSPSSSSSHKR